MAFKKAEDLSQIINNRFNISLAVISALLAFCGVIVVTVHVVGRWVFHNAGIADVQNIGAYLMPIIVFFGITYCEIKGGHVRIKILYDHFPVMMQRICDIFAQGCGIFWFFALTWQTFLYALNSYTTRRTGFGLTWSLWIPEMAIVLGCAAAFLQFSGSFIRRIVHLAHDKTVKPN